MKKELAEFSGLTANLFARFRVNLYKSVIEKTLLDIKSKNNPKVISLKLNRENNVLFLVPAKESLVLVYGLSFPDKTEEALARVFCQELDESKRHVRSLIEAKYYSDPLKPPMELKDVEPNPKRFASGFVSFSNSIIILILIFFSIFYK